MSARPLALPDRGFRGSAATGDGLARGQALLEPLLAAVASGDSGALAELYDATSRWVFSLALRLVSDRQLAEEVTLDVFLQIWRSAGTYRPERGRVASWILTIARSRALDSRRARHVRSRCEGTLPSELVASAESSDPTRAPGADERGARLQEALASLPPEQRSAVELAYFPGLSHSEIAARLGEPLGTIKTRIRLGLSKLREKLRTLEELP